LVTDQVTKNNRKWWFIGIGIGALMLASFILPFYFLYASIKGDAYQLSLESLKAHPDIVASIGLPVDPSWWVLGSVNTDFDGNGRAMLHYEIDGSIRHGTVFVSAIKTNHQWQVLDLRVDVSGSNSTIVVIKSGQAQASKNQTTL
jgi:hypothetical protein